jgi:iron only hydrogenase large subunit-like protein
MFSNAAVKADLNDFISPSQDCIVQQDIQISLNDCLACSGCITTAESILVNEQNIQEFYKLDQQAMIVSVSEQARASISAKYSIDNSSLQRKLTWFFKRHLKCKSVVDLSLARDVVLMETAAEFVEKFRVQSLPLLNSSCPGWICYAEKTHPVLIPYISKVKSPQQLMGSLVKKVQRSVHVTIMPCYDKKLEASRDHFQVNGIRDVDLVLTTTELEELVEKEGFPGFLHLQEENLEGFSKVYPSDPNLLIGTEGSSSGGYLSYIFRFAAKSLFNISISQSDIISGTNGVEIIQKSRRSSSDFIQINLIDPANPNVKLLRFAAAYGFKNIQNVVRKLKSSEYHWDYVEIMACPSGCINGGGQLKSDQYLSKDWILKSESIYTSTDTFGITPSESVNNPALQSILSTISENEKSVLFYTSYNAVEKKITNALGVKW